MNPILIQIAIRRFLEMLFLTVFISVVATALYMIGVLETKTVLCWGLLTGSLIFAVSNTVLLRRCYFALRSNFWYYAINLSVYLLFAGVSWLAYRHCSSEWFTWLFAITKWARYTNANLASEQAMLLFHAVGLVTVLFSPIGMSWIFVGAEPEREE